MIIPGNPHSDAEPSEPPARDDLFAIVPNVKTSLKNSTAARTPDASLFLFVVERSPLIASVAAILVGCSALFGWAFDIELLRSIVPGLAPMKPNTAIGLLLCGIGLYILRDNGLGTRSRPASTGGRILALSAASLGLATIIQYATNIDLGIDRLFAPSDIAGVPLSYSGRMSIATAFCLTLAGSALLLLGRGRSSFRPSEVLSLFVLLASLVSIVGYSYDVTALYSIGAFRSVAVHTAFTFFVLGIGILLSRSDHGIRSVLRRRDSAGLLLRRLLPAAFLVPFVFGWIRLKGQQAGLYGTEFGIAIFATSIIVVFGLLVWFAARSIEKTEEKLHANEQERRQIFERITDAFIAVDNDFRFAYVNSKAGLMLQRDPEDLFGKNMWDQFPEGRDTGFQSAYETAKATQTPVMHEEFYAALGIWIEIRVFPAPDGLSVYFHDVTERKNAEEKLRELNENLETRVAERTRELEAVNKELEAFSYSVSHDLRAPLRAIDGFSAAVVEDHGDALDEEARGYLARVRKASRSMGELIDDLLKLSRVSRAEIKRDTVNLSGNVGRIIERLREANPDRTVDVTIEAGLLAYGDEVLTRSVLENLLSNAWKFTSKTEHAKIEFGRTGKNGHNMFFVRDNGAGFEMKYRDKLFGAFQRLHSPAEFEGTGIGLATVQRIVNRHGGMVDAEGSTGSGATFYFTLGEENGHI